MQGGKVRTNVICGGVLRLKQHVEEALVWLLLPELWDYVHKLRSY